jgi:hypothetical protein
VKNLDFYSIAFAFFFGAFISYALTPQAPCPCNCAAYSNLEQKISTLEFQLKECR